MTVGEIAKKLPVTRPAVSQHLEVLKKAGLVDDWISGTRHFYQLDERGLGELRAWLSPGSTGSARASRKKTATRVA